MNGGVTYSEELAERVRDVLAERARDVVEIPMFGGLCFTLKGHMAVGIVDDDLMVRVGPDLYHDALTRPNVREMDFTGRAMKGMVYVGPGGWSDDAELDMWVRLGAAYADSLPPKPAKKPAKKKVRAKRAPTKKPAAKKTAATKKKTAAKKT